MTHRGFTGALIGLLFSGVNRLFKDPSGLSQVEGEKRRQEQEARFILCVCCVV
jgi:hypothetical protein